jgi:hypothetical protein
MRTFLFIISVVIVLTSLVFPTALNLMASTSHREFPKERADDILCGDHGVGPRVLCGSYGVCSQAVQI